MLFAFWGGYHCRRGSHMPHNASMASFRRWLLCSRSVSGRGGRCVTIAAVASIPAFQGVSTPDADESRSLATSHPSFHDHPSRVPASPQLIIECGVCVIMWCICSSVSRARSCPADRHRPVASIFTLA